MRFGQFLAAQEWVTAVEEYCTCSGKKGTGAEATERVTAIEELRKMAQKSLTMKDWSKFVEREEESLMFSFHEETCRVFKIGKEGSVVAKLDFDDIVVRSFGSKFTCSFDSDVQDRRYSLILSKDKKLWLTCETDFVILVHHEHLLQVMINPVEPSKKRKRDEEKDEISQKPLQAFNLRFAFVTLSLTSESFTRQSLQEFFGAMEETLTKCQVGESDGRMAAVEVLKRVEHKVPNSLLFLQASEHACPIQASLGWAMLNKRVQVAGASFKNLDLSLNGDELTEELLKC